MGDADVCDGGLTIGGYICPVCGGEGCPVSDRVSAGQGEVSLLADELNQFALAIETFAHDNRLYCSGTSKLFDAARRLRERIAELIPDG